MGRIASIDFGLKRIGLAITDEKRALALPLAVVEGGKKAIQNIAHALPLKEVDLIVMGLPLEMSGKKGEMAQMVEAFAKTLHDALNIPIELIDERLSSKGADQMLKEISLKGKAKAAKMDMTAAVLLLQTFLSRLAN